MLIIRRNLVDIKGIFTVFDGEKIPWAGLRGEAFVARTIDKKSLARNREVKPHTIAGQHVLQFTSAEILLLHQLEH